MKKEGFSLINECGMWNDVQSESFNALTQRYMRQAERYACSFSIMAEKEAQIITGDWSITSPGSINAGSDAVELHVASGYLIEQFLSLHSNKRTDEFGGSLHNRIRFLILIIKGLRRRLGNGCPVMMRLCVDEFMTGGYGIEEARVIRREA